MPAPRRIRSMGIVIVMILAACGAAMGYGPLRRGSVKRLADKYQVAPVSRTLLEGAMTTQGHLESSRRTVIGCELERVSIGVMGRSLAAGGASTLLTVIPDGSTVKEGDVLATLDSSDYEELVRQQQMTVERSRADHHQAELDLDVAKMAVDEYRNGLMAETGKEHERLISLAEAELSRSRDRLDWARRMNEKGYVSLSVLKTETQTYAKAEVALQKAMGARELFQKYTVEKMLHKLDGVVLARQANLRYQKIKLARNVERLEKLEKQVENCTIRAPHDGYVIYANDPRRNIVIEPGISVRQKQQLFYLPDLKKMEVVAMLHESIVDRVKRGMTARIALEGVPDLELTGRVRSISPLPIMETRTDVRYFEGVVSIDKLAPRDLLPGMTARIELAMPGQGDVLAVPVEAVTNEGGDDYCYVLRQGGEGLEKRRVALGQATYDLLEVADGLQEGEQVVLNPRPEEMADDVDEDLIPAVEPLSTDVPVAALH